MGVGVGVPLYWDSNLESTDSDAVVENVEMEDGNDVLMEDGVSLVLLE